MESVLNPVLETQAEEPLRAGRYERCEGRTGYRGTGTVPGRSTAAWGR